jgi:hypothetical protein
LNVDTRHEIRTLALVTKSKVGVIVIVPWLAWIVNAAGCADTFSTVDFSDPKDAGAPLDAGPNLEPDASTRDASTPDAGDCPGFCAPRAPLGEDGWSPPLLLWFGPKEEAPDCPAAASDRRWKGYADLVAPLDCPTCACEPPTGSCAFPVTLTGADAICKDDGAGVTYTPFDPPASWDGSCTAAGAIPAGSGVRSLTFGPLQMSEQGCAVRSNGGKDPKHDPPRWKTYAFACDGHEGYPPCKNGKFCMPAAPPPGFHACIFHKGEQRCPEHHPDQHVFYPEDGIADSRDCGTCTCAAPFGSQCVGLVSVYNDAACHDLQAALMMTSGAAPCVDILPAGVALGSKSAATPVYVPGMCTPWSIQPTGAATPVGPSTFCCQ